MIPHNLTMIPFRRTVRSLSFAHHRWINPTVLFVISRNSDESLSGVLNRTFLSDARPYPWISISPYSRPVSHWTVFQQFLRGTPNDLLSNIPDHQIVAYTSAISLQHIPTIEQKPILHRQLKKHVVFSVDTHDSWRPYGRTPRWPLPSASVDS